MTLDLTDGGPRARPASRGERSDFDRAAYRNSGQQTIPAAKIIVKVQKSFFLIV